MNKQLIATTLVCVLITTTASANISVKEYRAGRASQGTQLWMEIERYLLGAGSAFQNVDVWLEGQKRQPYYCSPPHLNMNIQNLESIIDARLERMTDPKYDEVELAQVLMFGLIETFPCQKSK
jgi:hypothetical protein